ncbi:hypothetical protein LZC95_15515 [Pendulispora brunnea]|uniref:DUF2029 domain-containing protein n=1 Tax=Pendulispora brunnea TaxID=2905690 RepID=A0ABZ2KHS5_9BACT
MRAWALRNWVFVVIALTYAYFYQGGDMNTNVRLALTRSIVERHALDITPYHTLSIDNGYFQGKYYSDKAPGISLLAVVPYGLMRGAEKIAHLDPDRPAVRAVRLHVLVILFAVVPGVLAAALLRWAAERLSISTPTATLLVVGYAWGTSAFAYSTMLFGHQLSAALVLGAFCVLLKGTGTERSRGALALFGALISWAWIVEYPTAFLSIVLGCSLLANTPPRRWLTTVGWVFAGAVPALALHATYAFLCYGSPLALPYQFVVEPVFRSHTSSGLFGIGIPTREGLWGISVSAYRGLFFYCPWLVLMFAGFGDWIRRGTSGTAGAAGKSMLALIALHVTFAASYYAWDGGLAVGPRHLVPLLPFMILPIAYFADRGRWQALVAGLAILVSMLIMLPIVAVTPMLPFGDPGRTNPLYSYVLPALVRGELASNWIDAYATGAHRDVSYNLGQLVGLPAYLSLVVPLMACLGCWGVSLRRAMAR